MQNKSSAGRPTKYNSDVQKFADDYIDNYQMYEIIDGKRLPNNIPSQIDLAFKLKVHRDTIANWGKSHPEFFSTLERINQMQYIMLQKFGLTRGYDATITKLYATNLTNIRDKIEQKAEINTSIKLAYKQEE